MKEHVMHAKPIAIHNNRQAFLDLAKAGIVVFPFRIVPNPKPGKDPIKKPCINDWQNRATTDLATIDRWTRKWPDAMPGIPMGPRTGLAVLDIDQKNGKDGFASLRALGFDPDTLSPVMVQSPSGSLHAYFRWPEGMGNSARGLPWGVDVRGEGGYVAAPGATHKGGTYCLLSGSLTDDMKLWPEALMPRLKAKEAGQGEPTGLPFPIIKAALMALPNDGDAFASRDDWLRIGMALHAETDGSEEGLEAFQEWSAPHDSYDEGATQAAWESFHAGGGVTGWTIIHDAESYGWRDPVVTHLLWLSDFDNLMTAEEEAEIDALVRGPSEDQPRTLFRPASELAGQPVKPRLWLVPDLIPAGDITMLGGDGGTGKSLLALQLAVATATKGEWIGQSIGTPGKVMFLSAEDDLDELHRRLEAICDSEGIGMESLKRLLILSRAGDESLLAVPDKKTGSMVASPLYAKIDKAMEAERPALLVLDTLADLHSGNENDRAHVRPFVQLLRRLAIKHGAAVVLLAHPSLTGIANGTGLSGNTAWNNSVRSRLFLKRIKEAEGYEPHPDTRVLESMKANYAGTGGTISLRWRKGVFSTDLSDFHDEAGSASAKAEKVFLKLLDAFSEQGRYVSANSGHTFAPALFAKNPDVEGCTKRALVTAMESLFTKGAIVNAVHGSGAKARGHIERARHGRRQIR